MRVSVTIICTARFEIGSYALNRNEIFQKQLVIITRVLIYKCYFVWFSNTKQSADNYRNWTPNSSLDVSEYGSMHEWGIMVDMYNTLIKAGKRRLQSLFPEWAIPTALGNRLKPSQTVELFTGRTQ